MTEKIDVIKQALEKGERGSISTKDFEYIIEQLQQSNKRIQELEQYKKQIKHVYSFKTKKQLANEILQANKRIEELEKQNCDCETIKLSRDLWRERAEKFSTVLKAIGLKVSLPCAEQCIGYKNCKDNDKKSCPVYLAQQIIDEMME